MKFLLICSVVIFAGCTTTPVNRNFPDVPPEIMIPCPNLKPTQPTEKLSDVLNVVVDNYGQYHECRAKVDTWVEWYKTQKHIFESVN